MFNINKPAFGSPSNTTSFFTSTPSRFGENFAKPNTPNFGEFNNNNNNKMAPNFGNTPFVTTNNSQAFAPNPFGPSSNNQPMFGNNLFNPQQNDIFGNQFTQNEKSTFNFTPKPTGFIFGQSNPQTNVFKQQSNTGIFPSSSNFGGTTLPGTVIKFVPVKLTDTSIIKGINQTINGRNQCITCMKEYEEKSLEELRWEDYQANRKGPQENLFFNNTTNEPMSMEAPTIFPQENLNKNLFGYKFGAVTSSNSPPSGLFGKPIFGFGAQNTTTSNFFGTTNTNTFQTPLFINQPQNQTTNSNIFNRNTPFNSSPTTSNNIQQQSIFPGLNTNTTFSFGNSPPVTSTAVIGQSTTNNIFNPSITKPSINPQPNLFTYKSAFPSLNNHATTSAIPNNNVFKYPTSPNIYNNQQQLFQPQNQCNFSVINQPQNNEQILSMSSNPYGLSDLLNNIKEIDTSIKDSTRATNPNELNTLLKTVKPKMNKIHDKLQPIQMFRKADQNMFEGLDENLTHTRNPKKLVLRKYSFNNNNNINLNNKNSNNNNDSSNNNSSNYNEEMFCSDLSGIFENMNKTKHTSTCTQDETVEASTQVELIEIAETEKENPAGVVLTRPEYYTVPPLENLAEFINNEDGSCIVQGFTIGRLGYGNVYFPEAFDVSNLNLDELVHFCYKEITIYPDDSKKPPRGEGLNRKAQITLDKVWPYDKKTNMLITDIDTLTEMDYADRLRRLCDRQQTKFVDYRPDTGSWVFKVEHFSKYGDEDDEELEVLEHLEHLEHLEDIEETSNLLIDEELQTEDEVKILSNGKCALMKSTFFDDICDISINNKLEDDVLCETNETLSLNIFANDDENQNQQDVKKVLCYKVPLKKSYLSYFKIYCDCAGFKGRSFKIGWGKNMQFTSLTHINNILENSIQINQIKTDSSILHECLEEHLNIQLTNSQYIFNNIIPKFSSTPGFNLLKNQEANCHHKNNFEDDIWKLCCALWNKIPQNEAWDARNIRKTLLTNWLQNAIHKETVFNFEDDVYNTIIKYLCLYRIEDATNFAFQQNNVNLSLLISQLPSNILTRNYLTKQLNIWGDMPHLINSDLLKIYLIICGWPKIEFAQKTICIYENMNWLQTLGFYLWFVTNPEEPISNGINYYEYSFINNNEITKPFSINHKNNETFDLRFQLLKYYSDNKYPIKNILNPLTYTNNAQDYRLSWFILQILESLNYAEINPKMKLFIHLNFAAQLEEMQQWHWAIFILLFIEDLQLKTHLIKDTIGRNIELNPGSIKKEQFLIHTLKIPSKWLDSAKATLAKYSGNNQLAICYLSYAEKWTEAYNLLMEILLPNKFFSYDYEFLNKILTPLSQHKHQLPNWDQKGGLILDFARLGIEYNNSNGDNDRFRKQSIQFRSKVVNIHARFRDISDLRYMRHVCSRNWSVLDHLFN